MLAICFAISYIMLMRKESNQNVTYDCKYHVVFAPKYRRAVLIHGVETDLLRIVREVCDETGSGLIEAEVMPDHVHLLLSCDPQLGIHRLVKRIKGASSRALRRDHPWLTKRLPTLWTNAYFVSTVGAVSLETVKAYVENQKGR